MLPAFCRQLFYQELVGKAKERAAREEAKKAEARDEFTRLLRHTKSLKLDSTWEDIKPDLETHAAYKDVSAFHWALMFCLEGNLPVQRQQLSSANHVMW